MQNAIDRIISTYHMLKPIDAAQEREIRSDLLKYLSRQRAQDEQTLTVEGLKYLRQR